jgi:hypothetical protein
LIPLKRIVETYRNSDFKHFGVATCMGLWRAIDDVYEILTVKKSMRKATATSGKLCVGSSNHAGGLKKSCGCGKFGILGSTGKACVAALSADQ